MWLCGHQGLNRCLYVFCFPGSSLAFNATQLNSSHTTSDMVGIKSALPKAMPISLPQIYSHKLRGAEEPGSSGLDENRPYVFHADSAEWEQGAGGMGAGLPTMSRGKALLDFKEENPGGTTPHWLTEILQPDGSILDLKSRSASQEPSVFLSGPDDSSPIVKVSFSEHDQQHYFEIPPQEVQGGHPTTWTLSDFYDYLLPEYSTTESYADDDQSTPADMEDENVKQSKKTGSSSQTSAGAIDRVENPKCLLGFVHRNGTCQSPCDIYTSYCFNGGQCYVVEGIGAFCG